MDCHVVPLVPAGGLLWQRTQFSVETHQKLYYWKCLYITVLLHVCHVTSLAAILSSLHLRKCSAEHLAIRDCFEPVWELVRHLTCSHYYAILSTVLGYIHITSTCIHLVGSPGRTLMFSRKAGVRYKSFYFFKAIKLRLKHWFRSRTKLQICLYLARTFIRNLHRGAQST